MHLLAFLWRSLFVSPKMVPAIDLLLDFEGRYALCFPFPCKKNITLHIIWLDFSFGLFCKVLGKCVHELIDMGVMTVTRKKKKKTYISFMLFS
jgi:hypothetical protein